MGILASNTVNDGVHHLVVGAEIAQSLQDLEQFLYGLLNGLSFGGSATCTSGLKMTIYYAF
jgi:hypothetical protein